MMAAGIRQNLGTYVSRESAIHSLDPAAKMLLFIVLIASILVCHDWLSVGLVTAFMASLFLMSKVGISFYLGSLRYFSWMFALSFAINMLFPRDPGFRALSIGALNMAGLFTLRLALMILAGTLFTVTTAPHEIADSVLVFTGLKGRLGRKIADLATILSISLRFIPVMFEEAERIRIAQMLRGQKAHGLRERTKAVVNLTVPLFQSSLRRATYLGFALEARCYGYMVPKTEGLRFGGHEVALLTASGACLTAVVLLRLRLR